MEYTRNIMEVEKRKLIKFSNYSLCITLPKWLIRELDWSKGDEVNIEVDQQNGKLIVSRGEQDDKDKKTRSELRW